MKRFAIVLGLAGLALSVALPAVADVIYDNGYDNSGGATASDFSFPNQIADDFQLQPGGVTITDVHWWGVYVSSAVVDDFTIRIFAEDNGGPAVSPIYQVTGIGVNRAPSGATPSGYTEYEYSVDIAPIVLSANTTYWLSIVNNTPNSDDWYWSHNTSGNGFIRISDTAPWASYDYEYSFYLTGPGIVPEPASLTLLGLGLAGLVLRKRREA